MRYFYGLFVFLAMFNPSITEAKKNDTKGQITDSLAGITMGSKVPDRRGWTMSMVPDAKMLRFKQTPQEIVRDNAIYTAHGEYRTNLEGLTTVT